MHKKHKKKRNTPGSCGAFTHKNLQFLRGPKKPQDDNTSLKVRVAGKFC